MSITQLKRFPYMAVVSLAAGGLPLLAALLYGWINRPPNWALTWTWPYVFALPMIVLLGALSLFVHPWYSRWSGPLGRWGLLIANIVLIDLVVYGAVALIWSGSSQG